MGECAGFSIDGFHRFGNPSEMQVFAFRDDAGGSVQRRTQALAARLVLRAWWAVGMLPLCHPTTTGLAWDAGVENENFEKYPQKILRWTEMRILAFRGDAGSNMQRRTQALAARLVLRAWCAVSMLTLCHPMTTVLAWEVGVENKNFQKNRQNS